MASSSLFVCGLWPDNVGYTIFLPCLYPHAFLCLFYVFVLTLMRDVVRHLCQFSQAYP